MTMRRIQYVAFAAMTLLSVPSSNGARLSAGGPFATAGPDRPVRWPNGGIGIRFNPDQGSLGLLTNAEAIATTERAFAKWTAIPSATASFVNAGVLPFDVDETNVFSVVTNRTDGVNPIIFDSDGAIIDLAFGQFSGVLGFTAAAWDTNTGDLADAAVILGGSVFGFPVSPALLFDVAQHEFGHFAGLDHSAVNGSVYFFFDSTGPSPFDTFPPPAQWHVEVMYPFSSLALADGQVIPLLSQEVLHRDDIAALSSLYPEPSFEATTGAITGRILGPDGITPLNGANVIARNLDNPFEDAVSSISGVFAGNGPPNELTGVYRLTGLTAGARYAVFVDQLPFYLYFNLLPIKLPGAEEFYNGSNESSDPDLDDPAVFSPVVATAAAVVSGVDIVLNKRLPGVLSPIDLITGSVELFPPFPVDVCGRHFNSLWLNINGTITFGEPDARWPGDAVALLEGPPRLAGLWTGLNPFVSYDTIAFDQTADTFTVRFTNIEEFEFGGSNTFAMTLSRTNGQLTWQTVYGTIDATLGLAGYSCGGSLTSRLEGESDLSSFPSGRIDGRGQAAVFEEFIDDDNDLDNLTVTYVLPNPVDPLEPNNSIAAARQIALPFHTADAFSLITPGDVDFYRFKAKAGDILLAETVPGSLLNTVIGLFQIAPNGHDGTLVASNDDTTFPFSRILRPIPADGEYAIAVSTAPDEGFVGAAGGDYGRYVLHVSTYRGTTLPLGDDESILLALPFPFPYQGSTWHSVWINSDGNLTFGEPDHAITGRTVARFLGGPPRIGPLFMDLDTTGFETGVTGAIVAETRDDAVVVHWISVPHFLGVQTNTFSVTLRSDGDVQMNWGPLSREDAAIVGITQGGGAPRTSGDLSSLRNASVSGTLYEVVFDSIDLWFTRLSFVVR